jgi:hypothetical protein
MSVSVSLSIQMKLVVVEILGLFGSLIACKFDKVPEGMYVGLDEDVPSVIGLGIVSESHIKLNVFNAEVGSEPLFTGSPLIKYSFDKESCTLKVGPEKIPSSRFEWISFVGDGKPNKELSIGGSMTLDNTFTLADDGTLISYRGFALKRKDTMDWIAELEKLQHLKLTRREVETIESLMNDMTEKYPLVV